MINRLLRVSGRSTSESDDVAGSTAAVRLADVTHEYGDTGGRFGSSRAQTVTALEDVTLAVETGETVGLQGPSGSGKSTILHAVAGLLVPTAGTVQLLEADVSALSDRARTRVRRRHVGIVFQRFHLLPALSARANVALPLVQEGVARSERRDRASTLLEQVGLGDRATHLPSELSGGERQRVAIARALAADPDVLVADEPTGELDTDTGETVLDLLTSVGRERAVLVASHDDDTLSVADRVVTLRDGRVIDDGR